MSMLAREETVIVFVHFSRDHNYAT